MSIVNFKKKYIKNTAYTYCIDMMKRIFPRPSLMCIIIIQVDAGLTKKSDGNAKEDRRCVSFA